MEFYLFRLLRTHRSINLYVVEVYVPCAKIKLNNIWFAKLFNVVLRSSFDFAWSKSFKDREFSDNVESEFDEFKLSRSQNTIYRHDLEGYDSLLIFLLGFLALLVDHVYETLILIDVEFGHVCDFDVDFHVTVTLQTVEVNIVLLHLQIMLFKCAFEVQWVPVGYFDVAYVEFAVEGHVDAVWSEGRVELDDELGVLLWAEREVVFIKTERRFGIKPEFSVERGFGCDCHADPDFVRFADLGPDQV